MNFVRGVEERRDEPKQLPGAHSPFAMLKAPWRFEYCVGLPGLRAHDGGGGTPLPLATADAAYEHLPAPFISVRAANGNKWRTR